MKSTRKASTPSPPPFSDRLRKVAGGVKKKGVVVEPGVLTDRLLRVVQGKGYTPMGEHELRKAVGLAAHDAAKLQEALMALEQAGRIAFVKGGRVAMVSDADLLVGRLRISRRGDGLLVPDDPSIGALEIPSDRTSTAMNGDRVQVRREVSFGGREPRGTVIKVLERSRASIVGTVQKAQHVFYVVPDDPRIQQDVLVSPHPKTKVGEKVVAEITEWKSRHVSPVGRVIEWLGSPQKRGVDMLSVLRQYALPERFPSQVLAEAKKIGDRVLPTDLRGRKDCRGHLVVTIDPDDAKDFDDAICVQVTPEGWRLWVHIADVSHYVREGSALDIEARRRANSTYLVDRVIPMLPEALSNELCSLKPDVDRLTKCAEFHLSKDGRVLQADFYSAVICSRHRLTYAEAMRLLGQKASSPHTEMLHEAAKLARVLRQARMARGSLDLDMPETKIRLDEEGKVLRVEKVVHDESHQLIEELMLLANEAAAARLRRDNRAALYRIHELPDPEKLQELRLEIKAVGISCGDLTQRKELSRLLIKLKEHPCGPALRIAVLRSLKRARYSPKPVGHFGLAKEDYAHFTSPIRRYADLVVHRALLGEKGERPDSRGLEQLADHISATERNSADAEQDSKSLKLMAYLQEQIASKKPDGYEGLITDIRNFGFFVEIEALGLSGLVPLSLLTDDIYQFDHSRAALRGRRHKRTFRLGERVKVIVARVDPFKKRVDFALG